jgi:hypothetical protein
MGHQNHLIAAIPWIFREGLTVANHHGTGGGYRSSELLKKSFLPKHKR